MRPSGLRSTASPFVRRKEKQGSQKLGLDFDHLEFSYNHRLNAELNLMDLGQLRKELRRAEAMGAHSKAKKVRREINKQLEQGLLIQGTWCGSCAQYLHRCRCKSLTEITVKKKQRMKQQDTEARALDILHRILKEAKRS